METERSIGEVARMTGVTARTLRHYDEIGLLAPSRVSANGYRWYGRAELRRLQRILLLRDLRLPLPEIRALLDDTADEVAFLQEHRTRLQDERARLDQVIETIDHTIEGLRGTRDMTDEEFFLGLNRRTRELKSALVARFGEGVDSHFERSEVSTASWTRKDHELAAEEGRELLRRLNEAREQGLRPDAHRVLDLMAEHYAAVRALWPADPASYYALGEAIAQIPQQRAMIAAIDPQLPDWLADAVRAYAVTQLGYKPHA